MAKQEDLDLKYHERCRKVCKALDLKLHGSSLDAGFKHADQRGHVNGEVSHAAMEGIEKLIRKANTVLDSVDGFVVREG